MLILVIKLQFGSIYLLQQVRRDELEEGIDVYDNNHELQLKMTFETITTVPLPGSSRTLSPSFSHS
jgi:hypothetical protein